MSKVIVHRHAAKYLKRLPSATKQRIKNILVQLEKNPLDQPGVKHMVGEWAGYHRIRADKLRRPNNQMEDKVTEISFL